MKQNLSWRSLMGLKKQLINIDDELLEKMFEFTAHAINGMDPVINACDELEIDIYDGLAFSKMITELGLSNTTSLTNQNDYQKLVVDIKSSERY